MLTTQGKNIVQRQSSVGIEQPKAQVFIDKRVPEGSKLFVSNEAVAAATVAHRATKASFAMSPLARGGQHILSLGTSKRNYEKIATPISKLLTPHEMTEL